MRTKKYLIQKLTQRMDSLIDNINLLEGLQKRIAQKEYKRLSEERLNLKDC